MNKYIIFFFGILGHTLAADFDPVEALRPTYLEKLNISQEFTKVQAKKALGAPSLEKENEQHWSFKGVKYPFSANYRNNKSSKIFVMHLSKQTHCARFMEQLKETKISFELDAKSDGKYSIIRIPQYQLTVRCGHGSEYVDSFFKEYK